jgi:hypothetical protein
MEAIPVGVLPVQLSRSLVNPVPVSRLLLWSPFGGSLVSTASKARAQGFPFRKLLRPAFRGRHAFASAGFHCKGWSQRRIARQLGLNRKTVGRYLRLAKPIISTAGDLDSCQSKPAISTTGSIAGRKIQCEPLAEAILDKVEVGLSAQRIYQDLVEEAGFADSYESVKRFVRKLRASHPERVWRLECQPGERAAAGLRRGSSERRSLRIATNFSQQIHRFESYRDP